MAIWHPETGAKISRISALEIWQPYLQLYVGTRSKLLETFRAKVRVMIRVMVVCSCCSGGSEYLVEVLI